MIKAITLTSLAFIASLTLATTAAAATATMTASVKVVVPLVVTQQQAINFGKVIHNNQAGKVYIANNFKSGAAKCDGDGLICTGTASRAVFRVIGQPNEAVTVELPKSATLANGSAKLTVDEFSLEGASVRTLPSNGELDLGLGARLNIGAKQAGGDYTGNFNVTVNY